MELFPVISEPVYFGLLRPYRFTNPKLFSPFSFFRRTKSFRLFSSVLLPPLQNKYFSKNKYIPFHEACALVKNIKNLTRYEYHTGCLHTDSVTLTIYFKIRSLVCIEHIIYETQRSACTTSERKVVTYFETNLIT
jgi:hypothetical protein